MKHMHIIPYFILFCIFSLGGVWSGRTSGQLVGALLERGQAQKPAARITKRSTEAAPDKTQYPLPGSVQPAQDEQKEPDAGYQIMPGVSIPMRQQNILFVWVDQLKSHNTILRGVWLFISVQDNPNAMLMPIYPSSANQYISTSTTDEMLEKYFKLTTENSLDLGFVMALQDQAIWWTDVLIMDDLAMQALVDFAGQAHPSTTKHPDDRALFLPSMPENSLEALFGQARLAQALCNLLPQAVRQDPRAIRQYLGLISEHVSGSMDISQMSETWIEQLQQGSGFTCEFPSMAAVMMMP